MDRIEIEGIENLKGNIRKNPQIIKKQNKLKKSQNREKKRFKLKLKQMQILKVN